jgi:hypothetical protein
MNKLVLALATSTVGLAVASAYLWKQLDAERDRAEIAATRGAELQTQLAKLEERQRNVVAHDIATAPTPERSARQAVAAAQQPATVRGDVDAIALYNIQQQKRRQDALKKLLDDPAGRELFLAQARTEARAENRDLARELQLTGEEYDRLIDLLAEHKMQQRDLFSRADDTITADISNELNALRDRLAQNIGDLLGQEKAEQYAAYDDSRAVRTQVRRLRGVLTEGDALTDEQTSRLVAALQKERKAFNKEMQRRIPNERVSSSMGTWYGGEFRSDRTSRAAAQEHFLQQTEEFAQRLRRSAAEILSAPQLRAFAQMQDEWLTEQRLETRTTVVAGQDD